MPIRADLRHFYGREWRLVVRPRILARAENKCEQCGVPNGATLYRVAGYWLEEGSSLVLGVFHRWHTFTGAVWRKEGQPPGRVRAVLTQLGVAHLNHTPGDDRDENLKALCRWCHLNYDASHHAETRATRKDAARPLLAETAARV